MHRSQGLTLLELIVVLAILSTLGTVMIAQTTSLTDEARYRQTVRTLEELQDAVIGRQPVGAEDPTAVPPGFVSDMGRLPVADADLTLTELWSPDPFVAADLLFRPRPVAGLDGELEILCGWRGPYVRLPVGSSRLLDGWGGPYGLTDRDGLDVDMPGDPVGQVMSSGPGVGSAFGSDPLSPFEVVFANAAAGIDRVSGSLPLDGLSIRFELPPDPSGTVDEDGVVRIYEVVNGVPSLLRQSEVFSVTASATDPTSTVVPVVFNDPPGPTGSQLTSVTTMVGPKVFVAYQYDDTDAPPTDPLDPDADLSGRAKAVVRFTLPAGGLTSLPSPLTLVGE